VTALLEVEELSVGFATDAGTLVAVDRVSFTLDAGETLGLVGESGCGKSATCLAVLGLLAPNGRVLGGRVRLDGRDLLTLPEAELDALRGGTAAMIFQDPLTSLNPVHTLGWQIGEALQLHRGIAGAAARAEATRLLDRVGITDPGRRLGEYPHQLSGGMNQRAMIAMALACRPRLLVADEPTTALDVIIQAQIVDLLVEIQREEGLALLLVTHDLGVVAEMADRVAVMYAGRMIETAPVTELFARHRHPYTSGLLASLPRVDRRVDRLAPIDGAVPWLGDLPSGCAFRPRCPRVMPACAEAPPPLAPAAALHRVACLNPVPA
jgi:oligopeptide/dipeptide ABC transporter ATP-binding protein